VKRWVVETQFCGGLAWALFPAKRPAPHRYYYRWRWLARLRVFLDNTTPPLAGYWLRSALCGWVER
jgi:hypothetical protein